MFYCLKYLLEIALSVWGLISKSLRAAFSLICIRFSSMQCGTKWRWALATTQPWQPPLPAPGTAGTGPSLGSLPNKHLPGTSLRGTFCLWEQGELDLGRSSTRKCWCYLGMHRELSPWHGGEQQVLVPKPHHCLLALQHPCIHAPPKDLQNTGLLFSLGSFHPGIPFNFSYQGLSFGVFRVHDISKYNLPCSVVWRVLGFGGIFPLPVWLGSLRGVCDDLFGRSWSPTASAPSHWCCKIFRSEDWLKWRKPYTYIQ